MRKKMRFKACDAMRVDNDTMERATSLSREILDVVRNKWGNETRVKPRRRPVYECRSDSALQFPHQKGGES